jgi:hypothetical protein
MTVPALGHRVHAEGLELDPVGDPLYSCAHALAARWFLGRSGLVLGDHHHGADLMVGPAQLHN